MKKNHKSAWKWISLALVFAVTGAAGWKLLLYPKFAPGQSSGPLRKNPPISFQDCDVCPQMIEIPEGSTMMGSPGSERERSADEGPLHKVSIHYRVAISTHEVTFAEWDGCVSAGACGNYRPADEGWGRLNRPVINVSWHDAQTYVAWLRSTTGKAYRLPTESEWEYAMRAGTSSPFHTGACVEKSQANVDFRFGYANCPQQDNAYLARTQNVGRYPPNPFGLYDMIGNVFEWVEDAWHESYAGAPGDGRAWTTADEDERRVVRGGSWGAIVGAARSANRFQEPADFRSDHIGFRVALILDRS